MAIRNTSIRYETRRNERRIVALNTIPRLPDATEQYDKHQMSQMIQTLEQMIFVLNNTYVPETLRNEDEQISWFLS